ncbi:SSU ribosomal protein S16P [Pelodictyon luteolum DSM 273]|uniref:Small ribosomal subunit protein bS16 n=1 Tax=Chlorobium luteolum (strain DSM 273 / BCRC 81028 / 2530) TaxID=319225 RepID=RS16_CHLL3|nr:RecName: Full=Small ribosomal subunit protein bS16; AltName: Full=30S ribosomal protein S16 [Pelodictyon luteolum DSM 273]ABB23828.1 SSU ribosomal protein S16P [Pelodictyon luteolum DSM 273]
MVKIRLRRAGRKKLPVYQIVAADARAPRDGKFLEVVGHYQPTAKPHVVTLDRERVAYWMQTGAQPTSTVRSLIQKTGLLYELRLKKLGRSEAEVAEEMEKWQEKQAERRQKRLNVKSRRRQLKKEAAAKPAVAEEVAAPVAAAPVAEAPVAEVEVVIAPEVQVEAAVEAVPEAPVAAAEPAPEVKAEEKEEGGEA